VTLAYLYKHCEQYGYHSSDSTQVFKYSLHLRLLPVVFGLQLRHEAILVVAVHHEIVISSRRRFSLAHVQHCHFDDVVEVGEGKVMRATCYGGERTTHLHPPTEAAQSGNQNQFLLASVSNHS